MVAYFSGCGCRRVCANIAEAQWAFQPQNRGVERGGKGRHDGWNNVL